MVARATPTSSLLIGWINKPKKKILDESPGKKIFGAFLFNRLVQIQKLVLFEIEKIKTKMNQTLKTMQIIHGALMTGIVLFMAAGYFVAEIPENPEENSVYTYLWLGITIPVLVAVYYLYNNRRSAWAHLQNESDKEQAYQTRMIIIFALLEAPCLFGTVLYILSAEALYLAAVAVLLLVFVRLRPTAQSYKDDLGFN